MSIFAILAVVVFMAFLVESLVEYAVGTPMDKIPALQPYKWAIMYVSAVVGLAGAFIYRVDLLYLLAQFLALSDWTVTPFGIVLTGLAIGRGANYINDIVTKYFSKSTQSTLTDLPAVISKTSE